MKIQDVITKPVVAQRNSLLINYYETYYITMKTTIMKFTILRPHLVDRNSLH